MDDNKAPDVPEIGDLNIVHPLKIFDIAKKEKRLVYACAPMLAFRQTVHSYGTDLCWTPMILAKEFNRNHMARELDLTLATAGPQPPTVVQFGASTAEDFGRAASLVAPYTSGVDLNCGCPQSWACAETLGAALMDRRELVRDMVVAARTRLRGDGFAVDLDPDRDAPAGRSVSVKIRVHQDLRRTVDFLDTVVGHPQARGVDFLTIHPRTRRTPSSEPVNVEALQVLVEKYGDTLPILLSGDVFGLGALPVSSPLLAGGGPAVPKLAGLMAARALLANPALFAGADRCPWEAVERFMNRVARAPLAVKLVQHHISEMTGPGMGPDKRALLSRRERAEMMGCASMCDLIDFLDAKIVGDRGRAGLRRDVMPYG